MKKILLLSLLWVLFACTTAFAQKDAPVAGNAATLIDLLKKDYNSIDPDNRDDEIVKDRAFVTSIFRAYLKEDKAATITDNTGAIQLADAAYKKYTKDKKIGAAGVITSITSIDTNLVKLVIRNAKANISAQEDDRQAYYSAKCTSDNLELAAIKVQYNDNTFISDVIQLFLNKYEALGSNKPDNLASVNYTSSLQKSLPFIGGALSYDELIDGLSKFLAKRIKEELTTFAMQNIKDWLDKNKNKLPIEELKILLPKTITYLNTFDGDKIGSFPNEIKQYIEDDLNHIMDNAYKLRTTQKVQALIKRYPDIDFAFEALQIIPNLAKAKYPIDYFTIISASTNINRWQSDADTVKFNIANSLILADMIAHSLIVVDGGEPRFASINFLSGYQSQPNFYRLYAGFLRQQNLKYYQVKFKGKKDSLDLCTLLNTVVTNTDYNKYKPLFDDLINTISKNADQVFNTADIIRRANKSGLHVGADTIHNFVKSILDFSQTLTAKQIPLVLGLLNDTTDKLKLNSIMGPYFKMAYSANDIALSIQTKKYANGISQLLDLTTTILPANAESKVPEIQILINLQGDTLLWSQWSKVVGYFKDPTTPLDVSAMNKFFVELIKVQTYYQNNETLKDQHFVMELDSARTILDNFRYHPTRNMVQVKADAAIIYRILQSRQFALLVMSYYSNTMIEKLTDDLLKSWHDLTYIKNGVTYPVFPGHEADDIVDGIIQYALAYFNFNIIHLTHDKSELNRWQAILITDAAALAYQLPQTQNTPLDPRVISLIHFVNDMALAQNSDDVEKAIEAFALPAGSYSIKRSSIFNVTLNSYPGLLFGEELTMINGNHANSNTFGFTAPVGLSVSFANVNFLGRSSLGVFVPLIDVGAVTRLRLDGSSDTQTLPDITLKNIFSPGLYITYGIGKTPFCVNLGGQYGPELKRLNDDNSYQSFRVGLGVTIDIPLFNLYTKPGLK